MKILVTGWFSFEDMGNTAGDIIARDVLCSWLEEAEIAYEVADIEFYRNVDWKKVNPLEFTDVLFVCGPFGNGWPITDLLTRFPHCRLIGVNLSLLQSLDEWNPFDLIYARDSSSHTNPDITFYAASPKVPIVGVVLAHKQKEYGDRSCHEKANEAIESLIKSREMSVVRIDTVLKNNEGNLRSPAEVETLISRMDVVITTRLHGTVLALKNGVPVIAIDPITGGAKITEQVKTVQWPLLISVDNLNNEKLLEAFSYCLTQEAKVQAKKSSKIAIKKIKNIHSIFIKEIKELQQSK